MFVWRDAIQLKLLDALAIIAILSLLALPALKIKANSMGVIHYGF